MQHFKTNPRPRNDFETGLEAALKFAEREALSEGRRLCVADQATADEDHEIREMARFRAAFSRMMKLAA